MRFFLGLGLRGSCISARSAQVSLALRLGSLVQDACAEAADCSSVLVTASLEARPAEP